MKKKNDDLVALGRQRAGAGTQSIDDDGAKEANTTTKNKRKKSKKDAGAKPTSDGVEVAGADLDASSDTSTSSNAGDNTKKRHKKGKKTPRESSPTPYVVANPDAKKLRKSSLITALDAMLVMMVLMLLLGQLVILHRLADAPCKALKLYQI